MTVLELISRLSNCDPDAEVLLELVYIPTGDRVSISNVIDNDDEVLLEA